MYAEKPIGQLSEALIKLHAISLCVKISIITGWQIPADEDVKQILYQQLEKKMKEDYSNLNIQEIEYAMRKYGTEIKDWGKSINLSLIDTAVNPYFYKRSTVRQLEESQIVHKELPSTEEVLDDAEFIKVAKDIFLKTKLTGLIPPKVYDQLEGTEIILTKEEKGEIRRKVVKNIEDEALQAGVNEMRKLRLLKEKKQDWENMVRTECKKQAVAEYFIKQQAIDNF
jgi:hypothetical protein